jgi:DNA-binding transcriptional regulator YiaG
MLTKTDTLLSELQNWCDAEHGRRAELARILGVPATRVSNWLTRKANPGSEATLKIIEFLENPEKFRKPGRGLK